LFFQTLPLVEIASGYISTVSTLSWQPSTIILLPHRQEATDLLDTYNRHIEYLHHVTYTPWLEDALKETYDAIDAEVEPSVGSVALLLGIFASSCAFFQATSPDQVPRHVSVFEAQRLTTTFLKSALDCLDARSRLATANLEALQAFVTVFFLMYNLEGLSSRARIGVTKAVGIAKDLGLHRLDLEVPSSANVVRGSCWNVEIEIKRRIWWHLVATDW
jgi:hypothetical protein